jgi:hypothetical protein
MNKAYNGGYFMRASCFLQAMKHLYHDQIRINLINCIILMTYMACFGLFDLFDLYELNFI